MQPHTPEFEKLAGILSIVLLGICLWGGVWFRRLMDRDRAERESHRQELEKLRDVQP